MKLNTLVTSLALSTGAMFGQAALAAPAAITLPPDLVATTFTNIDWANTGTAYTTGFIPVAGNVFTIRYFADAVAVTNGLATVSTPTLDTSADGATAGKNYELTTVANITERVVGCLGSTCVFDIVSGDFSVYYDAAHDANNVGGTGFHNGELLISGSVNSTTGGLGGSFTADFTGTTGTGNAFLSGMVLFTQTTCAVATPACIQPALTGTTFVTTLQLGAAKTSTSATGYDGVTFTAPNPATGAGNLNFQADGNQAFFVPEPDSIAILGLGLGAMGFMLRRRRRA